MHDLEGARALPVRLRNWDYRFAGGLKLVLGADSEVHPTRGHRVVMKLSGNYRLKASRDRVWQALLDPEVLRLCTPGCKQMTPVADASPNLSYDVLLEVGVAAVKGSYSGKIRITDQIAGSQYKLILTGSGSTGFLRAEGLIQLKDVGEETIVDYSGQAQIGGLIASVGQRVVEAVAKHLVGQFFKSFETAVQQQ